MPNKDNFEWAPRNTWIIPPGLIDLVNRFKARCEIQMKDDNNKKFRPLLIHGPTGVGKSLFVDYYAMMYSKVYNKIPKIAYINCAALPEYLIESSLFGHKKGAFTSAFKDKKGYFEEIGDGIIVLEEVGEMPKHTQAKLLLAIETGIFSKVGDYSQLDFNGKIIATTNASKDKFREDLWYRFDPFLIPPIFERRNDILYYLHNFNESILELLTPGIILSIISYNWPGNVREIERVCGVIEENIYRANRSIKFINDHSEKNLDIDEDVKMKFYFSSPDKESDFDIFKPEKFKKKLALAKVDHKKIEDCIKTCGISFEVSSSKHPFKNLKHNIFQYPEAECHEKFFKKTFNKYFELAHSGYLVFCKLFFMDNSSTFDVLDLSDFIKDNGYDENLKFKPDEFVNNLKLPSDLSGNSGSILPHCPVINFSSFCKNNFFKSNIEDAYLWPKIFRDGLENSLKFITKIESIEIKNHSFLRDLHVKNISNGFLKDYFDDNIEENSREIPITEIDHDKIRELYIETICYHIGMKQGFQYELAKITGFTQTWVSKYDFLKKLKENLKNNKKHPRKRIVILE